MSGRNTYDIDPLQKEILEHRAARRQMLREQYLKEFQNPYRHATGQGGVVDDIALNRYQAMRATATQFFKPTVKNSLYLITILLIPIGLTMWAQKTTRDRKEKKIRSGEISYRDRDYQLK